MKGSQDNTDILNEHVLQTVKTSDQTRAAIKAARAYGDGLYRKTWDEFDGLYPMRKRSDPMLAAVRQSLRRESEKAALDFLAGYLAASGVQVSGRSDQRLQDVLVQSEKTKVGQS